MTFRPRSSTNKEKKLSFIFGALAIILFVISGAVSKFVFFYQITALASALVSVEIYVKYIGSDYIYEASDNAFRVYKVTGKKSICVCSLDYEMSLSEIISVSVYNANRDAYPKSNFNVNFAKNFVPKDYSVYFFEFNGKVSMMKFEPDEIFANYTNEKIRLALKNKNSDEKE